MSEEDFLTTSKKSSKSPEPYGSPAIAKLRLIKRYKALDTETKRTEQTLERLNRMFPSLNLASQLEEVKAQRKTIKEHLERLLGV